MRTSRINSEKLGVIGRHFLSRGSHGAQRGISWCFIFFLTKKKKKRTSHLLRGESYAWVPLRADWAGTMGSPLPATGGVSPPSSGHIETCRKRSEHEGCACAASGLTRVKPGDQQRGSRVDCWARRRLGVLSRPWRGGGQRGLRADLELWATERGRVSISACRGLGLHLPTPDPRWGQPFITEFGRR